MAKLATLKPTLKILAPKLAPGHDSWRDGRTSSTARGYDYRWQQARAEYLRLHPFCVMCLAELGVEHDQPPEAVILACADRGAPAPMAALVDHIVPHRGDRSLFWDRTNWQGLCQTHHSGAKQRQEAADHNL